MMLRTLSKLKQEAELPPLQSEGDLRIEFNRILNYNPGQL